MHTATFAKNHRLFLNVEEFNLLLSIEYNLANNNPLGFLEEDKEAYLSLYRKGYIVLKEKKLGTREVNSNFRFFNIELEEYSRLRKKLTDTEIYVYYCLRSFASQGEGRNNRAISKATGMNLKVVSDAMINLEKKEIIYLREGEDKKDE